MNLGLCYIKFQWFKKACLALQSALDIDPNSAKGLYRLGKAKRELANYDEARKYFIKAQSVSDDPEIGRQVWSPEFSMGELNAPLISFLSIL